MRLHASLSTSTRPASKSRSGFATTSFQIAAKRIEVHQHPLKVGFPSCFAANGADTSNDDEDEWDYNTMFSTRSELNTIAAIENVTEIEYVQARCPESRKTGAGIASRFHTQRIVGVCAR